MSAPSRVNKENFRLLDLSSDEESEDLQLEIIPSRKKKVTRRERSKGIPHSIEPNIGTEVQCALRWAVRGTLLLWLVMLTWICATLYDQVSTMRLEVDKVSTGSSGVADALQICHSTAKDLHSNTTYLKSKIDKLELEYKELELRVQTATKALAEVSEQLSAAPKLADTPRRLGELQRTVADFGSQISGFNGELISAKKQAVTATTGVEEVRTMLKQLEARTNDTIANITVTAKQDEEMKNTLLALNTSLISKVDALRTRIEEITLKNNPVVPAAPASPVVTSSAAAPPAVDSVTPAPATTAPPGPPAKPSVLE